MQVTPDTSNLQFPAPSASQNLADCFSSAIMREAAARKLDIDAFLADETPPVNAQTPEKKKPGVFSRVSTTFNKATEKKKKNKAAVVEKPIVSNHSPSRPAPARPTKPVPQPPTSSQKVPKPRVPVLQLGAVGQAVTGSSTPRVESPGPQSPKRVTFQGEQSGQTVVSPRRQARTDLPQPPVSKAQQHVDEIDAWLADFANTPDTPDSAPGVPSSDSLGVGENTLQELASNASVSAPQPLMPQSPTALGRALTFNSFLREGDPGVDTLSNEGLNQLIALLDVDAESEKQPEQQPEKKPQ